MTGESLPLSLPSALPLLRARVTLRLLEDATLPRYQGAMLRGGFGYAFQRATCPPSCWNHVDACTMTPLCPYRWVFETPHPPDIPHLHDLRDVPRPFVIEPPPDSRTTYGAGAVLEFGLVLIGRGVDHLPAFLCAFEQLGQMGLGKRHARARLERVEVLRPWQPTGPVIYQEGRVPPGVGALPLLDGAAIAARARALPADLRLHLVLPLRVRTQGEWLQTIDSGALVQAICWRLHALSVFHGAGPWEVDYRALVAQASAITVEREQVRWVEWGRTSGRGGRQQHMQLGGLVGSAVLRGVPPAVRVVLLAGSLVHVGKACVFGHGKMKVESWRDGG
ncbi:MAG: CRISPR system precrRNA processing endoribonuclease RAMP protein Cas6 [Chloroflexaceae bacterium]|nr:CRISPR system precrRNA processing endoribonuclease RAMP protein Cas6 [Chloroflexaceae bacterium]